MTDTLIRRPDLSPGVSGPALAGRRRPLPPALTALAVLAVVPAALPIGFLLWTVLRPGGFDAGGFGVTRLLELLASTAVLVVAVTATTLVLGVATAWLTTRTDLPGRKVWSTLAALPLVIPSYVGALAMLGATGNQGLVTELLGRLGLGGVPQFTGFWAAWVALSLWNFPFVHLLTVPALRRLDPSVEEAAQGLGASRWRTVATVVVPQLKPALTGSALLVALYVMSDFGAVSLLRYETFTRAIYTQFRGRLTLTPALFLSGILVLIALVLVVVEQRSRGAGGGPTGRPLRRQRLVHLDTKGRVLGLGFLGALVTASLGIPLVTLTWWAVRGSNLGNSAEVIWQELLNTLGVAGAGAVLTAIAAVPVALLAVRHPGRSSRGIESVAWAAYSLPHIAVGIGFLVLAVRYLPAMYQSIPLLLIAYVALFMPLSLASTEAGLWQVPVGLEEASRGLGSGPWRTFVRVTGPLVWRSVLAGAALVFLTAMKELPATLLLRPTGFETLAVDIWGAASELFYTQASVAALVLVGLSAVPLFLLVARGLHD
jgi:iron(III) transport system permease protein